MITFAKRGQLDVIIVENSASKVEISLFGAHVLSFIPKHDSRERLWLSPLAHLDKSNPIRGGIPICWPWFGNAPKPLSNINQNLPAHGFIRNQTCELVTHKQLSDSCDQLVFRPSHYPYGELELNLSLSINMTIGKTLEISLNTKNVGNSERSFFAALHSYFKVDSIQTTILRGIDTEYIDKTKAMAMMPALTDYIINAETDRIHLGQSSLIAICQPKATTNITSIGNDSIVVWNPWRQLSENMADISNDGYRQMVCVETARTQDGVLDGQQSHRLSQIIG